MRLKARENYTLNGMRIMVDGREMEIKFGGALELRGGDYYVLRIPGFPIEPGSRRIEVTLLKAGGEERLQAMEIRMN